MLPDPSVIRVAVLLVLEAFLDSIQVGLVKTRMAEIQGISVA